MSQDHPIFRKFVNFTRRDQRNEFFEGGHEIHQPHFDAALKWFAEAAEK